MPKVDLTITISVVIAICAIISPIITTILNNCHQLKLKKLDMELESKKSSSFYKRGIYEDYLRLVGKCVTYANQEAMREYGSIYPLALIYFPESLREDLFSLNESITENHWSVAKQQLNELAPKIHTILQNM